MMQPRLISHPPEAAHYGNWVRHIFAEPASNRLALWLVHGGMLWLNSEQTSGKSHLLQAIAAEHPHLGVVMPQQRLAALVQVQRWLQCLEHKALWAVDVPAGAATTAMGFALFHLIERAKQQNRPLLIVWRCSNDALHPPELASRMRMLEQVSMPAPESDEVLREILQSVAQSLHWQVPEAVLDMMLVHLPRDLATQVKALKKLEQASFAQQKKITTRWAKQMLEGSNI